MNKNIFFRFDADDGARHGLGHFYRTKKIIDYLKRKFSNYKFYVVIKKNLYGTKIIKQNIKTPIIFFDKSFFKKKFDKKKDIFFVDTFQKDRKLIKFLSKKGLKLILFDQTKIDHLKKGLIINGISFANKKIFSKYKGLKIYQGPKYIFLDKSYSVKKNLKRTYKIKNAIVSSGGADKKNFLYFVTKKLSNFDLKKIFVIVGKSVKKNNKIFSLKKNKKVHLIINKDKIKKYFDLADVSFVTGGTVMFESIATGTPTLAFKNYNHQKYAMRYFSKLNCVIEHNNTKSFTKNQILSFFNYSKKNFSSLYKNNVRVIDGKGFDRVCKIIYNYLSL